MKFRPFAAAAAVLAAAALEVAVVAPAHAAIPDPVTNVAVSAQAQGTGQSWSLTFTWNESANADGYRVAITDHADGTNTDGSHYASKNLPDGATSATLSTDALVGGRTYWVAVRSLDGSDVGPAVTDDFQAIVLDTAGPVGAYKLDHTQDYVGAGFFRNAPAAFRLADVIVGEEDEELIPAIFAVTQTSLSDNTTPAAQITRKIKRDTNTEAVTWSSGRAILTYGKAGTYHPAVVLTDQFGNTSTIALPTITVTLDSRGPTVRITRPRPALVSKVDGWRVVRGRVYDSQSGPAIVLAMVVEKRGSTWYAYDFRKRTWVKGTGSLMGTLQKTKARPAEVEPNGSYWRTPRIRGLQAGVLHVETVAFDYAFNIAIGPTVHRRITN